jgi:hypothetical protein
MYVYIYIYIYIYIYMHEYICMYVCVCVGRNMYVCMYVYIHIDIYVYTCYPTLADLIESFTVCLYADVCLCAFTLVHMSSRHYLVLMRMHVSVCAYDARAFPQDTKASLFAHIHSQKKIAQNAKTWNHSSL